MVSFTSTHSAKVYILNFETTSKLSVLPNIYNDLAEWWEHRNATQDK